MALKAHLDPAGQNATDDAGGQRRQPRRALRLETSGVLQDGLAANVTIHNISTAGFLIETDERLTVGDRIAIDLPQSGPVNAKVVWESDRLYGCAFERALKRSVLAATQLRSTAKSTARPSSSPNHAEPLGIKLARLRRERGLTLAKVAASLGVSKPTVWAWEKGKARPVPSRLPEIAAALDIPVQELGAAAPADEAGTVVEECRVRIAAVHGTDPNNVRIMIEL